MLFKHSPAKKTPIVMWTERELFDKATMIINHPCSSVTY